MRILIIGGNGMLGSQLLRSYSGRYDVKVTLRRKRNSYRGGELFRPDNSFEDVDVRDISRVEAIAGNFRPDVVVNAAGMIKQRDEAKNAAACIEINALVPHQLRDMCERIGARLIHISTDCVFSGRDGGYRESSVPDATDVYGRSKLLGEVYEAPGVTLRTSIIGPELDQKRSLVEWFLSQRGQIKGFTRAIYTGFTTLEMARIIERVMIQHPSLTGLWHVASQPISKYELLTILGQCLNRTDVEIIPDDTFHCDRSLIGDAFNRETAYLPPSWPTMLDELANWISDDRRSKDVIYGSTA